MPSGAAHNLSTESLIERADREELQAIADSKDSQAMAAHDQPADIDADLNDEQKQGLALAMNMRGNQFQQRSTQRPTRTTITLVTRPSTFPTDVRDVKCANGAELLDIQPERVGNQWCQSKNGNAIHVERQVISQPSAPRKLRRTLQSYHKQAPLRTWEPSSSSG